MDGTYLLKKVSSVIYDLSVINLLIDLQKYKARKKNYAIHSIDIALGKFAV
jgi:hypothetical protein